MGLKKEKIIKRYQNRKLYDTEESCYVTLEDISEMIKMGDDVQVVDNHSKEDLTAITLAQIILEEQRKKTNPLPLQTFREIIQSGGEALRDIMHKTLESGVREIETVKNFVDDKVRPTVEKIQQIPGVYDELKQIKSKLSVLEKRIKEHEDAHHSQKTSSKRSR